MSIYTDPVISLLIDKLNAEGPAQLRNRYYQGDPLILPKSAMPVCFISRDTTVIERSATLEDQHTMSIVLNVVYDFARDLNQKAFVQAGTIGLYRICEGRGADMNLLPDTIAYVLRKYEVLDGALQLYIDVGTNPTIDYVLSPPSRRGLYSVEAVIRIAITHHQPRIAS